MYFSKKEMKFIRLLINTELSRRTFTNATGDELLFEAGDIKAD